VKEVRLRGVKIFNEFQVRSGFAVEETKLG
jgi:hypothetical protein